MNQLYQALLQRLNDLAHDVGVKDFRLQFKKNRQGEVVVALIIADKEGPLRVDRLSI